MPRLNIPSIFPGEFIRGYEGRIMRINCLPPNFASKQIMREVVGGNGVNGYELPMIKVLASLSGNVLTDILKFHTLAPFSRIILRHSKDKGINEGSNDYLWTEPMKMARDEAYLCVDCVHEDLSFHGISYWRRNHQLVGKVLCGKHKTGLKFIKDKAAFSYAPSDYLSLAEELSPNLVMTAQNNPLYSKFYEIWEELTINGMQFSASKVSNLLRDKTESRGFSVAAGDKSSNFLSDAIVEGFGKEWISTFSTDLSDKIKGEPFQNMEVRFFEKRKPLISQYFVLMLTYLYATADDALFELRNTPVYERGSQYSGRMFAKHTLNLLNEHLRKIGHYLYMNDETNQSITNVPQDILKGLYAFYVEMKDMKDCAKICNMSLEQFVDMIRFLAQPFKTFLVDQYQPAGFNL